MTNSDRQILGRGFTIAALLLGLVWGAGMLVLIWPVFGAATAGGFLVSPFIGLVVGHSSIPIYRRNWWWLLPWSVVSLYVGAILIGVTLGIFDLAFRVMRNQGPAALVDFPALIVQLVFAVIWGLSHIYLLYLWPLALASHIVLREVWLRSKPRPWWSPRRSKLWNG